MMPQATPARAIWLMAKMRLRRQANQIMANGLFKRFKKKKPRDGIAAKRGNAWIMTLLVAAVFAFSFGSLARTVIVNMQCGLVETSTCRSVDQHGERHVNLEQGADELHAAPFDPALLHGLTMELTVLFVLAVLLPLGGKELAQPDWDLEWLVTMPVKRSTLMWGRLLERSASNISGMFALVAPLAMVAWYSGFRWTAPPVALMAAALLLPLAALLQTLADTGLRMWLPASQLRNLQAFISLFNMPLMYLVMALGMPAADSFPMEWARAFPSWALWAPPGLALQAIQAQSLAQFATVAALLLAQIAALLWCGVALMRYQLRNGVVGSSSRESTRGMEAGQGDRKENRAASVALFDRLLSTLQRRELRLLGRDRNFLVQTLLLPVVIVGSQMVFNGKLGSVAELGTHHTVAAAVAFGIGSYVLMLSAFQNLNTEGHALWLLYTVPRSIESILREKAKLWGTLALIYPLMVLAYTAMHTAAPDWRLLVLALTVIAGIPIFSMIAVSLGVFAFDPTAVEMRTGIRPTYAYLYLMLAGFYTWSIYNELWSQKVVVMVLIAALAFALWQKARDALPFLLDPAAAPAPRVSASDGLMAATAFFILQTVLVLILADDVKAPGMDAITLAFGISGLVVYGLMRLIYWRSKTTNVPVILRGVRLGPSLRDAAIAIAVACVAGFGYLYAVKHSSLGAQLPPVATAANARLWLFALAVLAAPLCEEFIFRGLIFGGLRRSMPAWQAIAVSAAIFAVVHPALSMPAVFVVGVCTAWVYERNKTLLAPMLVHAVYNAAVMTAQM